MSRLFARDYPQAVKKCALAADQANWRFVPWMEKSNDEFLFGYRNLHPHQEIWPTPNTACAQMEEATPATAPYRRLFAVHIASCKAFCFTVPFPHLHLRMSCRRPLRIASGCALGATVNEGHICFIALTHIQSKSPRKKVREDPKAT